jgi:hypothetical protein
VQTALTALPYIPPENTQQPAIVGFLGKPLIATVYSVNGPMSENVKYRFDHPDLDNWYGWSLRDAIPRLEPGDRVLISPKKIADSPCHVFVDFIDKADIAESPTPTPVELTDEESTLNMQIAALFRQLADLLERSETLPF